MKRFFAISALLFVFAACADAAVTMALTPAAGNAARGSEVVFTGTLTNTSATDRVFLNDLQMTGTSASQLSLKTNPFFANVPGILLPGESYVGPLFGVSLDPSATADDYGGTITILGGADIFASDEQASAAFAVLSPTVSVDATDSSASEFGPDSGLFTLSRTGSTSIPLVVEYAILGSGSNGVSYNVVSTSATISSGSTATTVTITPLPNDVVNGDRTVIFSLKPSAEYNAAPITSGTVIIHDKPIDQWRLEKFGAAANDAAAADAADWDSDGIQNIVEYALALNPQSEDSAELPVPFIADGHLCLSYVTNPTVVDLDYLVEGSLDLVDWNTTEAEQVTVANPIPPNRVTYRHTQPVNAASRAFLRLRVQRHANP